MAIRERIGSLLPAIQHTDQDMGQLKQARPPVSWPCVLTDFEDFSFESIGEHVQMASGIVVLRLGFSPHSRSSGGTPQQYTEAALEYYDIEWALHKLMQGWAPIAESGAMNRKSAVTLKRTDGYRVRELKYTLAFEDYSTKRQLQYVPATINMSLEV